MPTKAINLRIDTELLEYFAETSRQGTQNTIEYDYINSVDGKGV